MGTPGAHPQGTGGPADESADEAQIHNERLQTRRGVLRSVGGSAGARLLVLPISAILGIIVTRLLIQNFGQETYAQYILLVGLAAMLPWADLGLTAPITNAVAGSPNPADDPKVRGTLTSALRVLILCTSTVVLAALALYMLGLWPLLLGGGLSLESGALAATLCLAVFGLNIAFTFGQRILMALGLNFFVVLMTGLQTPIVLGVLWLMTLADSGAGYLAVASYAATSFICVICLVAAARRISPAIGLALRDVPNRSVRGEPIFTTAWPLLVQMIAVPIAMSSDRLVLSHLGTLAQLTEYSLAAQIFMPVLSVVAASGMALWPVFARSRASGGDAPVSPTTMALAFGGFGALAGGSLWLLSPLLTRIASDGQITIGVPVLASFCLLIMAQAAMYALGTYLTDAEGLRFQAVLATVMLPVNIALTLLLVAPLGAAGPLLGSAISVMCCQLLPVLARVRRVRRTLLQGPAAEPAA